METAIDKCLNDALVVNKCAKSWLMLGHRSLHFANENYLIGLITMFMLCLALEPICSIHFFRLVIATIYKHILWI